MTDIKKILKYNTTALTGGIATGKSTVAKILSNLGAQLIDTDRLAREIVKPGTPALNAIIEKFGKEYILSDGTLNRMMMRDLIIKDPGKRDTLNSITHPVIMEEVRQLVAEYRLMDMGPVIIDVPLLFETGWDRYFTKIILVYAPPSLQIKRLMKRDNIDRKTAEITLKVQMPVNKKRAKSDFIVDNSGSLEETGKQVRIIFKNICVGEKEGDPFK